MRCYRRTSSEAGGTHGSDEPKKKAIAGVRVGEECVASTRVGEECVATLCWEGNDTFNDSTRTTRTGVLSGTGG
jgi:hypothetical protein